MALLLTTLLIAAAPQIHASTTSSGRHIPILLRPLDSSPGGFDPPIVSASPGDVLEFHFLKGNHSVALGDWDAPCNPAKSGGFFSGFQPVADGENDNIFLVTINDTTPLVFYCTQNDGDECKRGMAGTVNSNETALDLYKCAAKDVVSAGSPSEVYGGIVYSRGGSGPGSGSPSGSDSPSGSPSGSGSGSGFGSPSGSGSGSGPGSGGSGGISTQTPAVVPSSTAGGAGGPVTNGGGSNTPAPHSTAASPVGGGPGSYGTDVGSGSATATGARSGSADAPPTASGSGVPTGSPTTDAATVVHGGVAKLAMLLAVGGIVVVLL